MLCSLAAPCFQGHRRQKQNKSTENSEVSLPMFAIVVCRFCLRFLGFFFGLHMFSLIFTVRRCRAVPPGPGAAPGRRNINVTGPAVSVRSCDRCKRPRTTPEPAASVPCSSPPPQWRPAMHRTCHARSLCSPDVSDKSVRNGRTVLENVTPHALTWTWTNPSGAMDEALLGGFGAEPNPSASESSVPGYKRKR